MGIIKFDFAPHSKRGIRKDKIVTQNTALVQKLSCKVKFVKNCIFC